MQLKTDKPIAAIFKACWQLPVANLPLLGMICLLTTCHKAEVSTTKAFYHWQTEVDLDSTQQARLVRLGIEKLYLKCFDVDWDEGQADLIPVAKARIDSTTLKPLQEIVPCIFITNRSFQKATSASLEQLPVRVASLLDALIEGFPAEMPVKEIQIDCDWSGSTRAAYFSFLKVLKSLYAERTIQISTTIRLHQWADPQNTGVPPVDRGMLMFYNNGTLTSWEENNSILNLPAALPYLAKARPSYPLPLDWALPVFSWGVVFRDGSLVHLVNDLLPAATGDTSLFQPIRANLFQLKKNSYLGGYYLYRVVMESL